MVVIPRSFAADNPTLSVDAVSPHGSWFSPCQAVCVRGGRLRQCSYQRPRPAQRNAPELAKGGSEQIGSPLESPRPRSDPRDHRILESDPYKSPKDQSEELASSVPSPARRYERWSSSRHQASPARGRTSLHFSMPVQRQSVPHPRRSPPHQGSGTRSETTDTRIAAQTFPRILRLRRKTLPEGVGLTTCPVSLQHRLA
jgi:hypothetical protein